MLNAEKINEISIKINELIKSSPIADIEKNIYALIQGAFTKMELVSREEFDIQTEVLRKTREQLTKMEARLIELETQLKQK